MKEFVPSDGHAQAGASMRNRLTRTTFSVILSNLHEALQLVIEANRDLARRAIEGRAVIREDLLVPA